MSHLSILQKLFLFIQCGWCVHACLNNTDCSLNGVCKDGSCICDPQWHGDDCGFLSVLPTTPNNGFHHPNESSWGGSMYGPDDNGTYHMFLAHMSLHCGLKSWTTNSEVLHAIADNPIGPYKSADLVLHRFAHNPYIRKHDGKYILYTIGCGANSTIPRSDCTNGSTPPLARPIKDDDHDPCDGPHWTGVLVSESLYGPWTRIGDKKKGIVLESPTKTKLWITNPNVIFDKNGSAFWVYRQSAGCWPGHEGNERLGIARAANWKVSPLVDLTPTAPIMDFALEDQHVWRDFRGNYHILTHKKDPDFGPHDGTIGHLYSKDGMLWKIGPHAALNLTIPFTDGTSYQARSRERPQLMVKNGRPLYVSTGIKTTVPHVGDYTWTSVQPIQQ